MAYTTIDDPSEYFTTLLYTGNATDNRNLTNSANAGDFKPDWLWLKERSSTSSHQLHDSTRGSSFALMSDSTAVEDEDANRVQAFQTNGFQVGTASTVNQNTITMVAWQWKANGGTTASNTDGSITSTVQANTTAGFSIVTYTGNATEGATFGHGLGATPDLVIVKGRADADNWAVFNGTSTTNSRSLHLDSTDGEIPVSSYNFWNLYWDETRPSSTVVTLGVDSKVNKNSGTKVAYCFRSIQGYSKIGKYTGNGSTNGAFVYTGFQPAWILFKRTDSANNWYVMDNKRNTFNPLSEAIGPDRNNAEIGTAVVGAAYHVDLLSNGFKFRTVEQSHNGNGSSYVYMAFAEHPFVSSEGVPTTAR